MTKAKSGISKAVSLLLLIASIFLTPSYAVLEIEITQGTQGALPIAVVPFQANGQLTDIASIVSNDLNRSGVFSAVKKESLVALPHYSKDVDYNQWRQQEIEYLVVGRVIAKTENSVDVQFQLLDVYKRKQLLGFSFPIRINKVRSTAHEISDLIFEKITGVQGAFNTKIAYINKLNNKSQDYLLQVADTDGFNAQTVFTSDQPLMSPTWSPDGRSLAYVTYEEKRPEIYIQHLSSAKRTKITGFKGLNSAPSWSPDGSRIALVLSKGGTPDVYVYTLANKRLKRLTTHRAIDTEPVWLPDGKSLIFTSDRGGSPQLYRVKATGGKAQRLTFEGRYNSAAAVSPDGKFIAMVFQDQGQFRIAQLELDSGQLEILTDTALDESPSYSPNGKMILYASTLRNKGVLYAISIDGRSKHKLSDLNGDIREPVWGPFKFKR